MPYLIFQNSSENPAHTYTLSSMGSSYWEKCLCSLNSHLGCGLNFPWRITRCKWHLSASTPVLQLKTLLETMFHGAQFGDVWQAHILAVFPLPCSNRCSDIDGHILLICLQFNRLSHVEWSRWCHFTLMATSHIWSGG